MPGLLFSSIFSTTGTVGDAIYAYIKCDSLIGSGKGIIYVWGYSADTVRTIGMWETTTPIPEYTLVEIPLIGSISIYDDIQIRVVGRSLQTGTGQNTGFVRLKIDDIHIGMHSSISSSPEELQGIRVYPNPATDYIILDSFDETITAFEVYNVFGIKQKSILVNDKQELRLDIANLAKGVYFIQSHFANGQIGSTKFVKGDEYDKW